MRRAVIVGAAPEAFWDGRWTPELVICADGGREKALSLGLKPDIVLGDRDSGEWADVVLPAEKDGTDMEACVDYALREGAGELALLGATGGRLDHFLGNIGLLERAEGQAFILDSGHEIRLITGSLTVKPPHRHRYFSLIPLDGAVSGVTITGAKYPLRNAVLNRSATVGVSNEPAPGAPFTVSVGFGKALLIFSEKTV